MVYTCKNIKRYEQELIDKIYATYFDGDIIYPVKLCRDLNCTENVARHFVIPSMKRTGVVEEIVGRPGYYRIMSMYK